MSNFSKILKMSKNQAIVVQKAGEAKVVDVTVPKLRDDYIIVKTKAIALNPTDWKHVDFLAPPGTRVSAQSSMSLEDQAHSIICTDWVRLRWNCRGSRKQGHKRIQEGRQSCRIFSWRCVQSPSIRATSHSRHEGNAVQPEDGAFADYITAKGDIQIRIPDNISFEEASTLGVGVST